MSSCRHLSPALLLGLTLLAASPIAAAQPSQPTAKAKLAAEALADEGWELCNAGTG